ncbi:MAG: hypothetical protein HFI39_02295 [Lachnospiraceae bacterium]|nr:hypothetical protein [Lachnospiraceae bacterium]
MKNKLKESFAQIQAEETLKNGTKAFLAKKTQGYTGVQARKNLFRICAAACACILFMLLGGRWFYFTPTAQIRIDINPSIELGINRFDQVISVKGVNDDGRKLTDALDIKFKSYTDAMEEILDSDDIAALLSKDEIMTVTVTGANGTHSAAILSGIETCMAEQRNAYCYLASSEEVAAAHEMGLSYGKYRAFLEIQTLDPAITPETVQGMTMREIRELMDRLSTGSESETLPCDGRGSGHRGSGNCDGSCRGGGQGNGR